jgi:hypothetical protein
MRFWIREIMGWVLVGLGLFIFYICIVLLFNHSVIEVGPLFIIGIIVFRGGIHLLKVAVAARICMLAQTRIGAAPTKSQSLPMARSFPPILTGTGRSQEFRKFK